MAIDKEGTKQYMSIDDLPEISDARSGDRFIIQASTGTSLLNYNNLLIGLDNVTFKETIQKMNNFLDENEESVEKIGSGNLNVEGLEEDSIIAAINQLNRNILTANNQINTNTTNIESIEKTTIDLNEYINEKLKIVDDMSSTIANQAQTITNLTNLCNELNIRLTDLTARVAILESKS